MGSLIELHNISKVYQNGSLRVVALEKISFQIKAGEFVAIMGHSGSGKTTLLHILGCLCRPSSGAYLLEDQPINQLSDYRLAKLRNERIGFVFQSFNLLPRTTALHNVELPLTYKGIDKGDRLVRARKALESVKLADRMHHKPNELSGGEQQRVAIARALVNDPAIILADEPTGNLDSATGKEIMSLLEQLNKKGITIIMVTHEQGIARYAQRRILLKDGNIVGDTKKDNDQLVKVSLGVFVWKWRNGGRDSSDK